MVPLSHHAPRVGGTREATLPTTLLPRLLLVGLLATACSSGGGDGKAACGQIATTSRATAVALYQTGTASTPDVTPLLDAAARLGALADEGALDPAKGPERDLAAALRADAASLKTGQPSTDDIDGAYRALRALQATCGLPGSRAGVDPSELVGTFGVAPTPSPTS